MSDEGVVSFKIKSDGNLIPDSYQVISIETEQQVNVISAATIVFAEQCTSNKQFPTSSSDNFIPGKKISIEMGQGAEHSELFTGIVTSQGISMDSVTGTVLTVNCQDESVKMVSARKNATFQKMKDSAAISQIIGNYSGLDTSVTATDTELPLLQQYNCTDWDFVVTRAEANGLIVVNDNAKVSVIKPDADISSVATLEAEDNLLEFSADLNSIGQIGSVKASAWDPANQEIIKQEVNDDASGAGNLTSKKIAESVGTKEPGMMTTSYVSSDDLKNWANARVVKSTYSKINGTAVCNGTDKIKVGSYITLKGMGTRFDGDHLVSAVNHVMEEGFWKTRIELGLPSAWFSEMRQDITAPPASGLLPGIEGLCSAVVKKINDDPDNGFRVMIDLPMFNDDDTGVWARLAQGYASDGAGFFFFPEVDDEVIVGFLNNDPRFPVILGGVYSGKRKPQSDLTPDEKNSKKAIVTKSNLQLLFDDENKIITIKTPGDNSLVLDDKNKKIEIKDQNGNSVVMEDSGITIKSGKDITFEADQKITIKGKQGITQEASGGDVSLKGMNVKQTADTELSLKGNATASLQGGSELTLKGAMVMIN
jgi:Rhs element Vgr protein